MRIRADQLLHGFHGLISAAEFVVGSRHLIENLIAVLVTGILGEQPLIESDCLDGTFGSSISAHHPRQGSVGVAAWENGAFRCCAPLKLPIGFPRAGAGNCGGLIGRVGWRGRKRLSGLRCGNFPRLEVARVYAELLLDLQVRKAPHCFRSHRCLRCLLEEAPVTLHGLIEALIYLHLLHVRAHVMQVCKRRLRWLVMHRTANEERWRKHDRNGKAAHQRPSAPDWTRAVRS